MTDTRTETWTVADGTRHARSCAGTEECDVCGGRGAEPDAPDERCAECEGRGMVYCAGCA